MIDLSDDNDPMLFKITLPNGALIVQYMEVLATIQASMAPNAEPSSASVVKAIRESSRTPPIAANASDAVLIAAWHRMTTAVTTMGNG